MTKSFNISLCIIALIVGGCASKDDTAERRQQEKLAAAQKDLEESPDEMLSSFSVSGYTKGGKKEWDLEGKSANIMDELIQLADVTGKVYGKEVNMTIVADQGSLNRLDNNVHLEKNVLATTDDGATLTADYLDWDAQNQKLATESPVWIKRGMMEAEGIGIIGHPALNVVQLNKDVTLTLNMQDEQDPELAATPTIVTCDGTLEVEYGKNLAVFRDNVRVKDKSGEIFADKMDVYFAPETEKEKQLEGMEGMGIEKVVAVGNVEIYHGANISYSEKAVYDTQMGTLTLTGQPKLVIYSTEEFAQLK